MGGLGQEVNSSRLGTGVVVQLEQALDFYLGLVIGQGFMVVFRLF